MSLCHTEGPLKKITFIFRCKYGFESLEPHKWAHGNTSVGTTNLQKSAMKCNASRGLTGFLAAAMPSAPTTIPYTEGTHHVIIALMCTTVNWLFNSVSDKYYKMEVECLHPGTNIPAPKTVSLEINYLYLELLKAVQAYFRVHIQLSWSQLIN